VAFLRLSTAVVISSPDCIQFRIQIRRIYVALRSEDIRALLAEAGAGTLRRELGPMALVTLGIGAVIGAGIFVLSGTVASQTAGPALTLSMVFAELPACSPVFCYAELASMIPVGRERVYICLRDDGRAGRVDNRLGSRARVLPSARQTVAVGWSA